MYEELQWNVAPAISSKVSVHALTNYIRGRAERSKMMKTRGLHRTTTDVNGRTSKDNAFNLNDMEWWFELLVWEGKMMPRSPPEPGDEKKVLSLTLTSEPCNLSVQGFWRSFRICSIKLRLCSRRMLMYQSLSSWRWLTTREDIWLFHAPNLIKRDCW